MLLRRLFRRGGSRGRAPRRPASFVLDLIEVLTPLGMQAEPADRDAPEATAGARAPDIRSYGLLRLHDGPPHFINVTAAAAAPGHLAGSFATGFHWLILRAGLERAWPTGRVEAKRDFSPSAIGAARSFRWTALDSSDSSRAAADRLRALGALNDRVLRVLQDPGVLILEVAPEPDLGVLRTTLFLGNRRTLRPDEAAMLRDLCRTLTASADADAHDAPDPTP